MGGWVRDESVGGWVGGWLPGHVFGEGQAAPVGGGLVGTGSAVGVEEVVGDLERWVGGWVGL